MTQPSYHLTNNYIIRSTIINNINVIRHLTLLGANKMNANPTFLHTSLPIITDTFGQ